MTRGKISLRACLQVCPYGNGVSTKQYKMRPDYRDIEFKGKHKKVRR